MAKREKLKKTAIKKSFRLFKYFSPYKVYFFVGLLFLFLSSAATLTFPYLLGGLLDKTTTEEINNLAIVLLLIFLANAIFSFLRIYLFEIVTQKGLALLREKTYTNLIKLPIQFFNTRRVGELNSRISADISLLQTTFTTSIAEFLRQILTILGGIIMLSTISGKLTIFMLAVVPIIALIAYFFGRFIGKLSKQTQDIIAESNTVVEETLQGINVVKAFANEVFEINRYKSSIDKIVKISLANARFRGAFVSFIIFGLFGAIIGVIWYGLLLKESGEITQGDLLSFVIYTVFVGASFGGIADVYAQLVKATGATENLLDIIEETPEEINTTSTYEKFDLVGNIEFKEIAFSYPNRAENEVIKNISLKINQGEKIAFVGQSGAGKSTLVSLLLRFYEVTKGEISINNLNINAYNLTNLRENIAIVPQEVMLFGGTIKENILYGKPNSTDVDVEEAAKKANAHDFISSFPEGYKTMVGERGIQLSGGQKQRIAIARAVLRNPKILILDEATSSLDSESESLVQEALEKLMVGRTSIIIAHRLSTIKNVDTIYVIENGKISETGSYNNLVSKDSGIFKRLVELQNTN
jgi:ABC-type multidrug transport system fused ATPase/permease subunit